MIRKFIIKILAFSCIFIPGYLLASSIQKWELSEDTVYSIKTHPFVTTTVCFPEEIEGLKGVGFIKDYEEQQPGDFLCCFNAGDNHFSVTPLLEQAQPRNLNVITEGKIYVIISIPVKDPSQAMSVVKFTKSIPPEEEDFPIIQKKNRLPQKSKKTLTVNKMLSLIDLLKVLGSLQHKEVKAIMANFPNMDFKEDQNNKLDYGLYHINLRHVLRDNELDLIIFCFLITNKSEGDLLLDPESLSVRVGDHVYCQVACDLQAKLQRDETAIGYFVIQGDGEGSRNNLFVGNEFKISLDILSSSKNESF